ncbi:MAG: lasso peptide biosynthesis B2 protein [Acidobacteria bacterium]|nr:lasso peptide biosynthesis B2 protein [Acidobacteriota bacterium]
MPALAPGLKAFAALPLRAARLFAREPGSTLLLARMGAWVVALSLLVKLMPLPRAMALVAPRRAPRDTPHDAAHVQARLARLLDSLLALDFWVFTPTCWKRAPVLHRYLALEGIPTRVLFGVRREGTDALAGHAWLEAHGRPILEKTPPDYKVTYSFPHQ